jgi:hypothetical protein
VDNSDPFADLDQPTNQQEVQHNNVQEENPFEQPEETQNPFGHQQDEEPNPFGQPEEGNQSEFPIDDNTDPDQLRSAIKIQAAYRGFHARKNYKQEKQQKRTQFTIKDEDKAATKIQAVYKGRRARQEYQKQKSAFQTRQFTPHSNQFVPKEGEDQAATKIQAVFRSHRVRKEFQKEKVAAVKVQKTFRGFSTRKNIVPTMKAKQEKIVRIS